ncbi:Activating signal cointegrator 1 complex subunit 3 [Entamoeba marina]
MEEASAIASTITDTSLKESLMCGIGIHHAGLDAHDRDTVEELYKSNKIQILITTATLAWGVNLPAHLVIIKGTEYFDGKKHQFVDMPLTDVLQMMGRAGRPQFDDEGVAVIFTYEPKKDFLRKFLFEPFPLESCFETVLSDQLNAEIAVGNVTTVKSAANYLTHTYYFRRLLKNPGYYGYDGKEPIGKFLIGKVKNSLEELVAAKCIVVEENEIEPTTIGIVATTYYVSFRTVKIDISHLEILSMIADAAEYSTHPVRHEDDNHCKTLSKNVKWGDTKTSFDDPHTKVFLLLSAFFGEVTLPIVDFVLDTKSWTEAVVRGIEILQMVGSGRWVFESSLLTLVYVTPKTLKWFKKENITDLPQLLSVDNNCIKRICQKMKLSQQQSKKLQTQIDKLPRINVNIAQHENPINLDDAVVDITLHLKKVNENYDYAFLPRFPKTKQEGWYIAIFTKSQTVNIMMVCPIMPGKYDYTLLLLSDCYIGLDQQYTFSLEFY